MIDMISKAISSFFDGLKKAVKAMFDNDDDWPSNPGWGY